MAKKPKHLRHHRRKFSSTQAFTVLILVLVVILILLGIGILSLPSAANKNSSRPIDLTTFVQTVEERWLSSDQRKQVVINQMVSRSRVQDLKAFEESTKLYLRQRLNALKIYEESDLMQHINTFSQLIGDNMSVDVKIEDANKDKILLCSLPPLLTALTCNQLVTAASLRSASLRSHRERSLEVISKDPRAFVYHNFLTSEECEHLISLAKPCMAKSKVLDQLTGVGKESSSRTSSGTFLRRRHDKKVEEIEKRISDFTFIPEENGEALQVIHYGVGQKFEPHFDGYQRIATVLMYLSDVDEGGETVFPAAKGNISKKELSVRPKKGDALLFWSMRPDGSQDPSSKHGGSPVIRGNKWASTKWFHFQEYKYTNIKL